MATRLNDLDAESTFSISKDVLSASVGAIAVIGVMVYGLLAAAYDKFYSELGLTPADVGVQYGKTLGGAAALAILASLLMGLLLLLIWAILTVTQRLTRRTRWELVAFIGAVLLVACVAIGLTRGWLAVLPLGAASVLILFGLIARFNERWRVAMAIVAAVALSWLILATLVAHEADKTADRVKDGYWVEPPGSGGLIIFSVRAMPVVQLSYAGSSDEDQEFTQSVSQHRLLFLGQSNSQLVIYDATDQVSLILPAAQFRAPILNCETIRQEKSSLCDIPQ